MNDFQILPDGNIINMSRVDYIEVNAEKIKFYFTNSSVTVDLTPEWKKYLAALTYEPTF